MADNALVDIRGSVTAADANRRANESNALRNEAVRENISQSRKAFSEQEQLINTQFLADATTFALSNPKALPGLVDEGKRRGILDPNLDASQITFDQLLDMNQQALGALGGGQTTQLQDVQGEGGSLLQRDPVTNKLTQVQGRDQGFDRLLMQDTLARRRDAENRAEQERIRQEDIQTAAVAPTTGQKAADTAFGKEFVKFKTGGFADAQKGIVQLRGVASQLASGSNLTGPGIGRVPDIALSLFNPESLAAREDVEEVVQRNLRLILGAQFTEKEGERLIARAYNPNLDEAVNAQRVERLLLQMESALQAKQDASNYFETNGTLRGWDGQLPGIGDFEAALEEPQPSGSNQDVSLLIQQARDAIQSGADPEAVRQRLNEMGVDQNNL